MRFPSLDPTLSDRVLAAWSVDALPAAPADRLDLLHAAWLRHVPFENLTKLLHRAAVSRPEAARRTPAIFWREHLANGTGGTCFAATAAFGSLLASVGVTARAIFARLPAERRQAHVALLVETDRGPWLSDVGYALAAPIPIPDRGAVRRRTPHYVLELRRGVDGECQLLLEDQRGMKLRYRFGLTPARPAEWVSAWNATLAPGAIYLNRLALGRFGAGVRWILQPPDRVAVLSRRGVRTMKLAADPAHRDRQLARLFRLPERLVREARWTLEARGAAAVSASSRVSSSPPRASSPSPRASSPPRRSPRDA